ncbi:MAG: signal recognition particle-docking protein FtsY, partial [candidate division Zixibacteria bacterium]|nr:signal recognition particle-docking protein FtsY [candidate division Zixibacteria bacterium]
MLSELKRLRESLSKTRNSLLGRIGQIIAGRKLDQQLINEIEEILLKADIGLATTDKIINNLRQSATKEKVTDSSIIYALLKDEISGILEKHCRSAGMVTDSRPQVWLIAGVNGTGKTTTIGKLAHYFRHQGQKIMIAACDTFRAAAVEQLAAWAEKSQVDFIKALPGTDPAAVAFDAATAARARNIDYLLIDTAGRLHTKSNLMEELKKIRRVTEKVIPPAQVLTKLIIDGTTGQNALSQVKVFAEAVGCNGIIITKLD